MKIGFDNEKYLKIQSEHIKERIAQFDGKLYMELGGKLFDDHHASRVLPGFRPDSKLRMLGQLRDSIEIVIVVSAEDIEKNKIRADLGITYDEDVLRLRDEFMRREFMVGSVVITHYNGQHAADQFRHRLERKGIKSYIHYPIDGYPHNVDLIASDEGFGKNDYVETSRPLVIVTAPGPGSGKMATCLSQLYNEKNRRTFIISRFKIYSCKILHIVLYYLLYNSFYPFYYLRCCIHYELLASSCRLKTVIQP